MNDKLKKLQPKSGCRFYYPGKLGRGADVRLPEDTAHHAVRTLRLKVGDPVILFDGSGGEYLASIQHAERKFVSVKTLDFINNATESPLMLRLTQGMSSGERMDLTVQKAVELGVSSIQPIQTARSVIRLTAERATRKGDHWRKIAIAACEQSGRDRLPQVADPLPFNDWFNAVPREPACGQLRVLLSPDADHTLADLPETASEIMLLAGPEGGFTPDEASAAQRWQFQPIRLGPRVLRTETAALAALAAIQLRWGDFK